MKIIEYKLHGNPAGKGMVTPGFVDNGGYYHNPDDYSMIGLVPDPCEWYIPDTITYLTLAELKTRQLAIHAKYPMQKMAEDMTMETMTDAEVEAQIDTWYNAHS